ncbi:hypothetical protein WA158_007329 [Blastocystis sp. Blastoise]
MHLYIDDQSRNTMTKHKAKGSRCDKGNQNKGVSHINKTIPNSHMSTVLKKKLNKKLHLNEEKDVSKSKITVDDRIEMMQDPNHVLFSEQLNFMKRNDCLYCKLCLRNVDFINTSHIYAHINSKKHQLRKRVHGIAPEAPNIYDKQNNFDIDMCRSLVVSNRLLVSMDDEPLRSFVTKYTGFSIPTSRTLKDKYLPMVYNVDKEKIKQKLYTYLYGMKESNSHSKSQENSGSSIQVFVDSTTDICGREVVAVLCKLVRNPIINSIEPHRDISPVYLLDIVESNNINGIKYASIIYDTIKEYEIKDESLEFFNSDNASVMYKTAELMLISYKNVKHIPCICHLLNLMCTSLQENLDNSDSLIRAMNNYFNFSIIKKNKLKKYLTDHGFEDVNLIPQFVDTRWSSFFKCLLFHCKYIDLYYDFFLPIYESEKHNKQIKVIKVILNNPQKFQETRLELKLLEQIGKHLVEMTTFLSADEYPIINMYTLITGLKDEINNIIDNIDENILNSKQTNIDIFFDNLKSNIIKENECDER